MKSVSNEQTICYNDILNIQCPANQYISIKNASFCRDDTQICLNSSYSNGCEVSSTSCNLDFTANLKHYLNGKNSFNSTISQIASQDPCSETYKKSKIYFECSSSNFDLNKKKHDLKI